MVYMLPVAVGVYALVCLVVCVEAVAIALILTAERTWLMVVTCQCPSPDDSLQTHSLSLLNTY